MWYVIEANPTAKTFTELSAIAKSNISYELAGSTVIFTYAGKQPTTDIKVDMIFTPKERRTDEFTLLRGGNAFNEEKLSFYDGCTWDEWCVHGVLLNGLYNIVKTSNETIRVYKTATKFFEFTIGGIGPSKHGSYNVTSASGYGASEPE